MVIWSILAVFGLGGICMIFKVALRSPPTLVLKIVQKTLVLKTNA
jgi:hypothetical protein